MNKSHTITILRQHYANLVPTGPEIFRAEHQYNEKVISVFYFDLSESVTREKFDLNTYMQERIASDFYKHEGSLQWNYYLYFVLASDTFRKFQNTPMAAVIEADRTFARKFIREQTNLEAELKQPLASILHATAPSQDIASRWVEELKDAGLAKIADPAAEYTAAVEEYLQATPVARKTRKIAPTATVSNGHFIQSLHIDRFRAKPTQRYFEFGLVNLVRGPNGTGKTSLLEAVELCICGGNRRQQGKHPDTAKLRIQYEGNAQAESCPQINSVTYRARDLEWYGGYHRQGNYLYDNFGRFNFFDSDAAFKLSSDANGEVIVKALNALLLGELATTVEERMVQFQKRFTTEERQLQRLIRVRQQEVDEASAQIKQLNAITDTRDALSQDLASKAEACGWQKLPSQIKLNNLVHLKESVEDIATQLAQHVERLPWLTRVSIAALNRHANQLEEAFGEIEQHQAEEKKNTAAWERTKNHIIKLENELKLLRRLAEYHNDPHAFSLLGLNAAIKEKKQKLGHLKEASSLIRNLDLSKFSELSPTLDELASLHDKDIAKRRLKVANLNGRESDLRSQLDAFTTLVQEIKGLGHRFCEISPHSTDCPLCGAHYDQLSARIASLEFGAPMESALRDLTAELARERANLVEIQKHADALTQLRQASKILFPASSLASRSTKAVVSSLVALDEKLAHEKEKTNELTSLLLRLERAGFEEEELQEILHTAQEVHSLPPTKLTKKETVNALVSERAEALNVLRRDDREKEKTHKNIDLQLSRIIKRFLQDEDYDDGLVELDRRGALAEEILSNVRNMQGTVSIQELMEFTSIEKRLDVFAKSIDRIQQALKAVEHKSSLEQRLADNLANAKAELGKLEPRHARAKTACSVLAKLLGSEYKEAYLKQIISDHKTKLSTIFTRIHAPHEFKNVRLNANVILERDSGGLSSVSEISTGQRAALALSIFLSLNSSVNTKAPWLLFDDPIVHVDDLNILSFFDMLRDLVILGNRQVFFATANTKIADLFTRKFDFLGDNFRSFDLQRQN